MTTDLPGQPPRPQPAPPRPLEVVGGHGGRRRRSQGRSHDQFEDFYRSQGDTLRRAVILAVGEADLGTDAADEAMARACERWTQVSGYDNPGGWTYRVALNWARTHQRRYKWRDRRSIPEEPWLQVPGDPDLARALAQLTDDHRAVVVCRYYLDWSVDETAAALDIPAGTVKSRLARALDTLKSHLEIAR